MEMKKLEEYSSLENYKYQLDIWYKAHNISREKIELFHDFLLSLFKTINDTYLGSELFQEEKTQKEHFDWCWKQNIKYYNNEKIFFNEKGVHYQYFWNLFFEGFYIPQMKNQDSRIGVYFLNLFNLEIIKTRSELDIINEVYKLLNLNLKK